MYVFFWFEWELFCPPSAPSRNHRIVLNFTFMETECTYDYLFVYDGDSYQSPLLASLSGNTLPQPIEAKSGKVRPKVSVYTICSTDLVSLIFQGTKMDSFFYFNALKSTKKGSHILGFSISLSMCLFYKTVSHKKLCQSSTEILLVRSLSLYSP